MGTENYRKWPQYHCASPTLLAIQINTAPAAKRGSTEEDRQRLG